MKRLRRMLIPCCLILPFTGGAHLAKAGTVISVTSNSGSFRLGGANNEFLAASWSQAGAYANVSIAFESQLFDPAVSYTGTAYLTTQIGQGATLAQEVASAGFTVSSAGFAKIGLFSGLSLTSGTYYLLLTAPTQANAGWIFADSPVITSDTGVSSLAGYFTNAACQACSPGPDLVFPPDSTFLALSRGTLAYEVNGTAVPEPSAFIQFSLGLAGVILAAKSRRALSEG